MRDRATGQSASIRSAAFRAGRRLALVLLVLLAGGLGGLASAGESLAIRALTTDLGDPGAPDNCKLEIRLPESLPAELGAPTADNFQVYIHPAGLGPEAAQNSAYLAAGGLAWRWADRVFLDLRQPPRQEGSGACEVLVKLLAGGRELASGRAAERVQYKPAKVDVVLVIDSSRSMIRTDPRRQRVAAARAFIDLAARAGRIGSIGIIAFSNRAEVLAPLTAVAQRDPLLAALEKVGSDGQTNMDRALAAAEWLLEQGHSERGAVVFLTDGHNEPGEYRDTHRRFVPRQIPVFAIGLSDKADQRLLETMAAETGGRAFAAATDKDLLAIYLRIAAEIDRGVLLFTKELIGGESELRLNVPVDRSIRGLSLFLDTGGAAADLRLSDPSGRTLGEATAAAAFLRDDAFRLARVAAPTAGDWQLGVRDTRAGSPYTLTATAVTDLYLDLFPPQLDGRRLTLAATLAAGGAPVVGSRVRLLPLDRLGLGGQDLYDDGAHADGAAGDGVYATALDLPPNATGELTLNVRAWGDGVDSGRYVRQTAALARGPARPAELPRSVVTCITAERLDLGTRLPGESAEAVAKLTFVSETPQALKLEFSGLAGPDGARLPETAFTLQAGESRLLAPGPGELKARVQVPAGTSPGKYTGQIRLAAGTTFSAAAVELVVPRVDVGFELAELDLGTVTPGARATGEFKAGLDCPRDVAYSCQASGPGSPWLTVGAGQRPLLTAGADNRIPVALQVPSSASPGKYASRVRFACGPAVKELLVAFTVPQPAPRELPKAELVARAAPPPPRSEPPAKAIDTPALPPAPAPAPAAAVVPAAAAPVAVAAAPVRTLPVAEVSPPPAYEFWRPYLFWALLTAMLLLVLLILLTRQLVRHRMARFALVSTLAHLLIVLAIANYFVIVQPRPAERRPVMIARLVDSKPVASLSSEAERSLLADSSRSLAAIKERRFLPAKAENPQPDAQRREAAAVVKTPAARMELTASRLEPSAEWRRVERLSRPVPNRAFAPPAEPETSNRPDQPAELAEQPVQAPAAPQTTTEPTHLAAAPAPVWNEPSAPTHQTAKLERPTLSAPQPQLAAVGGLTRRESLPETAPVANSVAAMRPKTGLLAQARPQVEPGHTEPALPQLALNDAQGGRHSPDRAATGEAARPGPSVPAELAELAWAAPTADPRSAARQAEASPREPPVILEDPLDRPAERVAWKTPESSQPRAKPAPLRTEPAEMASRPQMPLVTALAQSTSQPDRSVEAVALTMPTVAESSAAQLWEKPAQSRRDRPTAAKAGAPLCNLARLPDQAADPLPRCESPAGLNDQLMQKPEPILTQRTESPPSRTEPEMASAFESASVPARRRSDQHPQGESSLGAKTIAAALAPAEARVGRPTAANQLASATWPTETRGQALDAWAQGTAEREFAHSRPAGGVSYRGRSLRPENRLAGNDEPAGAGAASSLLARAAGQTETGAPSARVMRGRSIPGEWRFAAAAPASEAAAVGREEPLPTTAGAEIPEAALPRPVVQPRAQLTSRTAPPPRTGDVAAMQGALDSAVEIGSLSIVVGRLVFSGEWTHAGLSCGAVVAACREGLAGKVKVEERAVRLKAAELADCQILLMAGSGPFVLDGQEALVLGDYLNHGGSLWVMDSSRPGDESFALAARRELSRLAERLATLPSEHQLTRAGASLAAALGQAAPEFWSARAGQGRVLFTRGDWTGALALSPERAAAAPYLTTARAEALRLGLTVITYFLGGGQNAGEELLPATPGGGAVAAASTGGPLRVFEDFTGLTRETLAWSLEKWSDPGKLALAPDGAGGEALRLDFSAGPKGKIAARYDPPARLGRRLDLHDAAAVLVDIYNGHAAGLRASLVLTTHGPEGWRDFETAPLILTAGWNRNLRFPLAGATFRSRSTGWRNYDTPLTNPEACGKLNLFLYPDRQASAGTVLIDNLRLAGE